MQIQTYTEISEFLDAATDFLLGDEVINGLILGVMIRAKEDPSRLSAPPYLATVSKTKTRAGNDDAGREIVLAAMITPPHALALSYCAPANISAVEAVAQNLWENEWSVPEVRGPDGLAQQFAGEWTRLSGRRAQRGMDQRVYMMRKVLIEPEPMCALRQAEEKDIALVGRWLHKFGLEALGEDEAEQAKRSAEWLVSLGAGYLWEDQAGTPVSFAMWARPTINGITVTGVYTPTELRGRGYASSLVAALSQLLLDRGWSFCTLFTDLSNPTSNKIYQRIGYEPVCNFDEYRFESE